MTPPFLVSNIQSAAALQARTMCPHCRHVVLFEVVGTDMIVGTTANGKHIIGGQRRCAHCGGHLFVLFASKDLVASYPPVTLDFDHTDIPSAVADCLIEALRCHSLGCYVAAAIMVRRTLEELCKNKNATGSNLVQRIEALRGQVTLPDELFKAMHDLRLLGNDAAHVEANTYQQVGKGELEVAILFTKEILKAVYQYSALLASLQSLKKPKP